MADSVTFPEEFGGSGLTVTGDSDPNTGLGNGGHRERFVPALAGAVDMAAYAKARAAEAAADREQTGKDKQGTAADAKATAEDREQTGKDKQGTAADAKATAADRVQTGKDRQGTAADKTATSADRIQTGKDRQGTAVDAEATAADRIQTGEDRKATAADVEVTAADREQTGKDAAASRAKAEQVDYSLDQAMEIYGSVEQVQNAAQATQKARTEAENWADYPADSDIPGTDGKKSARHWATKAMERTAGALIAQGAWDASTGEYPTPPEFSAYWLVTGATEEVIINGERYRNKDMLVWTKNSPGTGGVWTKIDNTDSVASVAGKTGAVTLVPADVKGLGTSATRNAGTGSGNVMPVGAFDGPTGSERFIHTGNMQFPRYEVERGYINFTNARNEVEPLKGMFYRGTGSVSTTTIVVPDHGRSGTTMTIVFVFSNAYVGDPAIGNSTWEGNIVWAEGHKPKGITGGPNNSIVVTMVWLDWPGYWLATTTYIEGARN